jgi:uncharacterized membrane protein
MKYIKKFKNAFILTSTIGLIITFLTLIGVINNIQADNITKLFGTLILILIQIGILTNPDKNNT